ncbi:hypothetical protein NLG97_g6003 [Lecanicillium saksenae]|uniref:Uncharacterized protein n=1 Tax=Lecanicillium saksenae TaxID=468837 RepID=A0ACC1QU12_9HYPO|nr:hypothetical protein NLG97_g6003 [Lecanicillium saksenae]
MTVLELPETLINIFSVLKGQGDSPSLLAVVRVNRQWFECGISVLWRDASCEALAAVSDEARRQLYASKIEMLDFSGDKESALHEKFRGLAFSNLREVSLDSYHPKMGKEYYMRQYFSPALRAFSFYGGDLDDQLLNSLREHSWRLRRLLIDNPGDKVSPEGFLQFISEYGSLQEMIFVCGMEKLLSDDMLVHLAGRPDLTHISAGRLWPPTVYERILETVDKPFSSITTFRLHINASEMPLLTSFVPRIKHLDLQLHDLKRLELGCLSTLSKLQSLSLTFSDPFELSVTQLMSLAELGTLESLALQDAEGGLSAAISDADFELLTSKLPKLENLVFMAQSNLSSACVLTLAKHCKFLESCEMPHMFDFERLDLASRSLPLFPKLERLSLGGLLQTTVGEGEAAIQ